jgi:hypothetical protein
LLEFAILVWTIPAPVVQIDIAIPATGASGRVERLQHPADPSSGHNKVYEAPRELIDAALTEMPRNADGGLCCGAGGTPTPRPPNLRPQSINPAEVIAIRPFADLPNCSLTQNGVNGVGQHC